MQDNMIKVEPIERRSIVEAITESLRARILANELREGQILRQEALAEGYKVSRMPVRDALRQLEAEGLVVFHRNRGALVSRLDANDVDELFNLRRLIEMDLLRKAAPRATKADIDVAGRHLRASEVAFGTEDVGSWGELNWKFHEALYRPAQLDRSLGIAQMLNLNTDRYVRIQLSLGHSSLERAEREHRDLLDVYAMGDGDAAAQLLDVHLSNVRDALLHAFKV